MSTSERTTCPECNCAVVDGRCVNQYCNYRGKGWTLEQRETHGETTE